MCDSLRALKPELQTMWPVDFFHLKLMRRMKVKLPQFSTSSHSALCSRSCLARYHYHCMTHITSHIYTQHETHKHTYTYTYIHTHTYIHHTHTHTHFYEIQNPGGYNRSVKDKSSARAPSLYPRLDPAVIMVRFQNCRYRCLIIDAFVGRETR
jgi:hypothetical protein